MPLTVSMDEGLTIAMVTSNPKSKWPVLCQILGYLCYSPVCSVSRIMIGKLANIHIGLGIVQMIIGVINIAMGILLTCLGLYENMYRMSHGPFWIGGVVLGIGIICILVAKFPSSCLLIIGMVINMISAGLAIAAIVLYANDLSYGHDQYCRYDDYYFDSRHYKRRPTSEESRSYEICQYYNSINKMICGGLDIMLIVLSVLQLCVTISLCVLTLKTLCRKTENPEEDPEDGKPLLKDDIAGAA